MDRKLASIQEISSINPIYLVETGEPAANIEQATVLGWELIVKKGEFQPGDKCVYFEVDSIVPTGGAFAFLRSPKIGTLKYKKFRDEQGRIIISQGLALPVSVVLPELNPFEQVWAVGEDVTDYIGVTKYEAPIKIYHGKARGSFPSDIVRKTDETRIQACMGVLGELSGLPAVVTMKMDGSSATYFFDENEQRLRVCSRNLEKSPDGRDKWWYIAEKYGLEEKLRPYSEIAIQGEICGPGIQNNLLQLEDYELFIFNVWSIPDQNYLSHHKMIELLTHLGLPSVPVIKYLDAYDWDLDRLKQEVNGQLYPGTKNPMEGVVIRPQREFYSPTLRGRCSFKCINVEYSVKYGG